MGARAGAGADLRKVRGQVCARASRPGARPGAGQACARASRPGARPGAGGQGLALRWGGGLNRSAGGGTSAVMRLTVADSVFGRR